MTLSLDPALLEGDVDDPHMAVNGGGEDSIGTTERGNKCVVCRQRRDGKGMPFSDALRGFSLLEGPVMIHKRR